MDTAKYLELIEFTIKNEKGTTIDIKSLSDNMVVYEGLDRFFMTATMVINMPESWFRENGIRKGCEVNLVFKNKNIQKNFNFVIIKKEPVEYAKDMARTDFSFILYMVDSYFYLLNFASFREKYKGNAKSLIESAFRSKGINAFKFFKTEDTITNIDFVGMNYDINKFLKFICRYSIAKNNRNHGFLFYQNFDGFNFTTLDSLLSQSSSSEIGYANSGYDITMHNTDTSFMQAGYSFDEESNPVNNIGVVVHSRNNECSEKSISDVFSHSQFCGYDREIFSINDNKYDEYISRSLANARRVADIKNFNKFNIIDMAGDVIRTSGKVIDVTIPKREQSLSCLIYKVRHVFKSSVLYRSDYKMIIIE